MDIDYLLLLQNFREGVGSFLAPYLYFISEFAHSFWPMVILAMLYWVLDRKNGKKMIAGFVYAMLINGFLKLTFCVYRPWIRDSRIEPYGNSKTTATGYSFPSGHSTRATATFGAFGYYAKKHKKTLLCVLCWFITLSVLFARNYLGVHTPQDVVVGFLSTILMMIIANAIENWTDKNQKRDIYVIIGGILICIALLCYYNLKTYPLTYLDDGSLLVDPEVMKSDSYEGIGLLFSYVICRYFERRNNNFEKTTNYKDRFIIGVFALIPAFIWYDSIVPIIKTFSSPLANFLKYSVYIVYVMIIVPKLFEKIKLPKKDNNKK